MRILHVFRAPVGGLFRHVADLARGQSERGHEVGLICDARTGGARAEAMLEALRSSLALGVKRVPMSRLPGFGDVASSLAVAQHARRLQPDILHGHGAKGGVFARLARTAVRPPAAAVYTPHGGSFHYPPGSAAHIVYMTAERLLARRTALFIFESGFVRDQFHAFVGPPGQPERVVHNGLAESEFEPLPQREPPFDLLFIGELRKLKGVDVLIDALALLRDRDGLTPRLVLIGAGPDETAFRTDITRRDLAGQVTIRPPCPIREALAEARVMVVPSRAESLPYVVLEAAAAGRPLIATRVGGIPEIFGPKAYQLVRPDDSAALAEAIADRLRHLDRAQADAAELRAQVHANFSISAMVENILASYTAARSVTFAVEQH
ncbi:glycosyltransferase family 4 protein [Chelatococcus sp. GCM10030263]|uniref:glycosyltransferase family 4 protein n=1 Tax=Chelatococcus sp. GCM10030263 TaxID=3273387 RepID=UPI0036168711